MDRYILFIYLVCLGGRCAGKCILHTKVITHNGKIFLWRYTMVMALEEKKNYFCVLCICLTGLQPVLHFLFASSIMQTWVKTEWSSTYWIKISSDSWRRKGEKMTQAQALLVKFANVSSIRKKKGPNNCNKFESGSCSSASNSNALCLHLLIGLCMWQQKRLP